MKSSVAMAVVLLGLGIYIYSLQSKRSSTSEIKPKAVQISKDQIEELVIKSSSGDVSTVTKASGSWQMTAPLNVPADETAMNRIVALISGLEIERVIDEHPADVSEYGLAPPKVEVTLKTSGAARTERLLLGGKTPVGTYVYAQLSSSPRVLLIASDLEDAANKSASDFRDKAVFRVDRDKIDSIEIDAGGPAVRLVKHDLDWEMTKPVQTGGDLGVISEFLTKLMSTQMASIVDSPASVSAPYRLDKPVATVTLAAGSSRETLQVGARADESNTYARNLSRPAVFTIPTSILDALKNEPANYRRKDVFDFQTIDATRVEVVREGQTAIYEKSTAPDSAGKWREISPQARDIDPAKIDAALSKLSYLRAVSFVAPPTGLAKAAGAVSVLVKYDGGKKSETVQLAKPGADAFALRADWPDAARLDANAYGLLIAALDDLQK